MDTESQRVLELYGKRINIATEELKTTEACLRLADSIGPLVGTFKVHAQVDEEGPPIIKQLIARQTGIWNDVKLHDTINTVMLRAAKIFGHDCGRVTMHASGGIPMMEAVVAEANKAKGMALAVTVLTSLSDEDTLRRFSSTVENLVRGLAYDAVQAGAHGIICSPKEATIVREVFRKVEQETGQKVSTKIITPGVRFAGTDQQDQKRVDTPYNAVLNGADEVVLGRAVTEATDPLAAVVKAAKEIEAAVLELQRREV